MRLPRTDPLRRSFFTSHRRIGIIVIALALCVGGFVGWQLYPLTTRNLTLMKDGNWYGYFKTRSTERFLVKCVQHSECRKNLFLPYASGTGNYLVSTIFPLLMFLSYGIYECLPKHQPLYNAKFATDKNTRRLRVNPKDPCVFPYVTLNGKWLGTEYNKKKRKILDNVLVEAPPRTGKSVHAKGVLGTFTGSMVVIDIKGELYADTANFRQDVSDVFKLNLVGPSAKYNPLADIGRSELELKAAAELLVIDPHDHDPIFAQRSVPAIRAALVAADLAGEPGIPYIADLIRRGPMEFIETLLTFHNEDINNNLTVFLGKPPEQFMVDGAKIFDEGKGFLPSAWGTLVTRLEPFTTQAVLDMMSGNDFTAKELLEREITVFFTFPERLLRSSSRVIALILEGLLSGMASHADENGGSGEVPCLVLMDEAPQYRVPSLPGYISTLLGRGIALLIYIQSEAQLRASYKEDADIILDNCRSKLYWSPTLNTAKHLSSAFGYREVKQKSKSHQGNTESRVNESYVKRELMTPDEIMQIGPEEAFLLVLGYPPIRGKRIVWYEEKLLVQRLKA